MRSQYDSVVSVWDAGLPVRRSGETDQLLELTMGT